MADKMVEEIKKTLCDIKWVFGEIYKGFTLLSKHENDGTWKVQDPNGRVMKVHPERVIIK